MQDIGYEPVQHIKTDLAGEWRTDCKSWDDEIVQELKVKMQYVAPERHESNGIAERACGIVESTIKALLMQNNLPPAWWVRASRDAEFLLNRFPIAATHISAPMDGDSPRPIELFTHFYYSRKQCDRELTYYVPVGTPCLVHDKKALGSTLGPKVRWGIACGMSRDVVRFMCPFLKSQFVSKSFTAYKLRLGLNYAQFLGLRIMSTTQKLIAVPGDVDENIKLRLHPTDFRGFSENGTGLAELPSMDAVIGTIPPESGPIRTQVYAPKLTVPDDGSEDEAQEAQPFTPESGGTCPVGNRFHKHSTGTADAGPRVTHCQPVHIPTFLDNHPVVDDGQEPCEGGRSRPESAHANLSGLRGSPVRTRRRPASAAPLTVWTKGSISMLYHKCLMHTLVMAFNSQPMQGLPNQVRRT